MDSSPNFKAGDFLYILIPGEAGEEETLRIKGGQAVVDFCFYF